VSNINRAISSSNPASTAHIDKQLEAGMYFNEMRFANISNGKYQSSVALSF
jgi:hypothetical protein